MSSDQHIQVMQMLDSTVHWMRLLVEMVGWSKKPTPLRKCQSKSSLREAVCHFFDSLSKFDHPTSKHINSG